MEEDVMRLKPRDQVEPTEDMLKDWMYTYADLAQRMRVGQQTIMEWVKRGRIPSPIYIGATARFTREQYLTIIRGPQAAGSFVPADSIRSKIGRKGGGNWRLPKGERKKPSAFKRLKSAAKKKPAKKKPTPKKSMPKKKGGQKS